MIYGMDTEKVALLAAEMSVIATRLRSIEQRLTAGLASTEWVGNDRTRFDAEWSQQHVMALRQAAEALDQASDVATANVQEQERISA